MTTSAQAPDRLQTPRHVGDHPTVGMDPSRRFVDESFELLDHRTRATLLPAAGAAPGRYLSIEHDGQTYLLPLQRPITHIGRGLVADVRLEDANVSRRHAIVALRGDGARILDDRSSNGTFVNGREVTVAYLSDGDVLRFGSVVLRYVEIPPRPKATPMRRVTVRRHTRRASRSASAGATAAVAA